MANDKAFNQVYRILKNQFKSIDMRGIFAYSHNERIWRCAFLKLYFTKLDTTQINKIHENIIEKYKIKDQVDFRIFFEARKIEEEDSILKDIQNSHVKMSNIDARPMGSNYQKIFSNNSFVTDYRIYTYVDEIESYSMKALVSKSPSKPIDVIKHCKVDLDKYQINFSELIYPLAINDINEYTNLLIVLPIYCKQIENDSKEYISKIEIHNKLTHGSHVALTLKDDTGKVLEKSGIIDIETLIKNNNQEMNIFYLPEFKMPVENYHKVSVHISHNDIGDLLDKTIRGEEMNKDKSHENIDNFSVSPLEINTSVKLTFDPKKIFIVHGHDGEAKQELARTLTNFGLNPIILHEQPDGGRTLIEKFEGESLDAGYAFILLTPDDNLTLHKFNKKTHKIDDETLNRARQNVVFEMGYFMGKLGRGNVCCLYKEGVELPSDLHGIVYKSYNKSINELYLPIKEELRNAKYEIKEK